jgi:hypothetical protein
MESISDIYFLLVKSTFYEEPFTSKSATNTVILSAPPASLEAFTKVSHNRAAPGVFINL